MSLTYGIKNHLKTNLFQMVKTRSVGVRYTFFCFLLAMFHSETLHQHHVQLAMCFIDNSLAFSSFNVEVFHIGLNLLTIYL